MDASGTKELGTFFESFTKNHGWVWSKKRKFIIVRASRYDITVIPIYTHNEKGIAHRQDKENYLGIRDDAEVDKIKSDSPYGNIVAKRMIRWRDVPQGQY